MESIIASGNKPGMMMIELRRMDHPDKINFPGASTFRDGCEPLIGQIKIDEKPVTIIIDDRGLLFGWGEQYYNWHEKRLPFEGVDLLNILFQLQNEMTNEFFQEILSNYCCRLEM
jgi:hypothetical protein